MNDMRPLRVEAQMDPGNWGKIIAGIIVVLVIAIIAGFGTQAGWFKGMHQAVPDQNLPQASMPVIPPNKG